ncbi:MAG: hypothetical protein A2086_09180 [Spirochaetes bacterium GWD1_27_9]|nr:MAG: hypothetical protein A2Z98_12995 [Spirochaetes bacterium GWB1_27_13]OHD20418.1 MAG: hypothetical protein A2Y34_10555 [Spirochaetes bacterium GWC1_27_15]OHD31984.1 MAG: hypothetical protein A2086_09180 [Spirochaetes bacterium GWD1_27_9]
MKKIALIIFVLSICFFIFSKESKIQFNGVLESTINLSHYKNNINHIPGGFNWGWSNQANLRFKTNIGDYLSFGFAININTLSGSLTNPYRLYYIQEALSNGTTVLNPNNIYGSFLSIPFYYKSTYVGSFELERLYFKGGNDYFDIEAGLIRLARGYGFAFSPIDLFNPRDAFREGRPEGKLAVVGTFYPMDLWKIQTFVIAPDNPIESRGWGFKFGAATIFSVKKLNFEFLYTLFTPEIDYLKDPKELGLPPSTQNDFTHIAGFSMKADVEVGLFVDMIYRFEQRAFRDSKYYGKEFKGYEGLEAAIGVDYTLPGGKVYLLLEYMFYGSGMLDWWDGKLDNLYSDNQLAGFKKEDWANYSPIGRMGFLDAKKKQLNFLRHNYLFGLIRWKTNDYLNLSANYMFGIDDQSGLLSLSLEVEPFQAFTINLTAMYPFDWYMLNTNWQPGEFGNVNLGFYQNYKVTVKVRF